MIYLSCLSNLLLVHVKKIPYVVLEEPNFGPLVLITPKRNPDALSEVNPQAPLPPHSPARALNELLAAPQTPRLQDTSQPGNLTEIELIYSFLNLECRPAHIKVAGPASAAVGVATTLDQLARAVRAEGWIARDMKCDYDGGAVLLRAADIPEQTSRSRRVCRRGQRGDSGI